MPYSLQQLRFLNAFFKGFLRVEHCHRALALKPKLKPACSKLLKESQTLLLHRDKDGKGVLDMLFGAKAPKPPKP
jgi:hypothetical protein